jgi:hypothetical protein
VTVHFVRDGQLAFARDCTLGGHPQSNEFSGDSWRDQAPMPLQRFHNCYTPVRNRRVAFFINRGPRRQVFVCGVEVKATLQDAGKGT